MRVKFIVIIFILLLLSSCELTTAETTNSTTTNQSTSSTTTSASIPAKTATTQTTGTTSTTAPSPSTIVLEQTYENMVNSLDYFANLQVSYTDNNNKSESGGEHFYVGLTDKNNGVIMTKIINYGGIYQDGASNGGYYILHNGTTSIFKHILQFNTYQRTDMDTAAFLLTNDELARLLDGSIFNVLKSTNSTYVGTDTVNNVNDKVYSIQNSDKTLISYYYISCLIPYHTIDTSQYLNDLNYKIYVDSQDQLTRIELDLTPIINGVLGNNNYSNVTLTLDFSKYGQMTNIPIPDSLGYYGQSDSATVSQFNNLLNQNLNTLKSGNVSIEEKLNGEYGNDYGGELLQTDTTYDFDNQIIEASNKYSFINAPDYFTNENGTLYSYQAMPGGYLYKSVTDSIPKIVNFIVPVDDNYLKIKNNSQYDDYSYQIDYNDFVKNYNIITALINSWGFTYTTPVQNEEIDVDYDFDKTTGTLDMISIDLENQINTMIEPNQQGDKVSDMNLVLTFSNYNQVNVDTSFEQNAKTDTVPNTINGSNPVLTVGQKVNGDFEYYNDTDVYQIDVTENSTYQFLITSDNAYDASICSADGTVIQTSDKNFAYSFSSGIYYLFMHSDVPGLYSIDLSQVSDDDYGNYTNSPNIGNLLNKTSVSGKISYSADVDVFSIPSKELLSLTFTADPGISLEIEDANGKVIHTMNSGDSYYYDYRWFTGNMYIFVNSPTGVTGSYTINDQYDLNQTTAIQFNTQISGTILGETDEDKYTFTVTQDNTRVQIIFKSDTNLNIELYSSLGFSKAGIPYYDVADFNAGTYYINISGLQAGDYTFSITTVAADDYADNTYENLLNIGNITGTGTIQGKIDYTGDIDEFKVNIPSTDYDLLTINNPNITVEECSPVTFICGVVKPVNGVIMDLLSAFINGGYLNITGVTGTTYEIDVTPVNDIPNSLSASDISQYNVGDLVPLIIENMTDTDVFKLSVSQSGDYTIDFNYLRPGVNNGAGWNIYDQSHNLITTLSSSDTSLHLDAGTYYFQIDASNIYPGIYSFQLNPAS